MEFLQGPVKRGGAGGGVKYLSAEKTSLVSATGGEGVGEGYKAFRSRKKTKQPQTKGEKKPS